MLKGLVVLMFAFFLQFGSTRVLSQQEHHASHNMLLYGSDEVFAYHVVFRNPHNYQVILRVNFDENIQRIYLNAKTDFPNEQIILLLNHMDISKIADATSLNGSLLREDSRGQRTILNSSVHLDKESFKILFFDELPLSLGNKVLENPGHVMPNGCWPAPRPRTTQLPL